MECGIGMTPIPPPLHKGGAEALRNKKLDTRDKTDCLPLLKRGTEGDFSCFLCLVSGLLSRGISFVVSPVFYHPHPGPLPSREREQSKKPGTKNTHIKNEIEQRQKKLWATHGILSIPVFQRKVEAGSRESGGGRAEIMEEMTPVHS